MNYLQLLQKALRLVVKSVLEDVQKAGLQGENHFYITFKTNFPGVFMPVFLREQYPSHMTIVLQHEFWNLVVSESGFSVDLYFSDKLEHLEIPFNSIMRFEDPSEAFNLDFVVDNIAIAMEKENLENERKNSKVSQEPSSENNIISLDEFRKNREPKN